MEKREPLAPEYSAEGVLRVKISLSENYLRQVFFSSASLNPAPARRMGRNLKELFVSPASHSTQPTMPNTASKATQGYKMIAPS